MPTFLYYIYLKYLVRHKKLQTETLDYIILGIKSARQYSLAVPSTHSFQPRKRSLCPLMLAFLLIDPFPVFLVGSALCRNIFYFG